MHVKLLQTREYVAKNGSANLALFIYVSTHYVETVR